MAVIPYCTQSDVEAIWSEWAVEVRLDDDEDGDADAGLIDDIIEMATTKMNKYLFRRYLPSVVAASAWAKWACAYIASYHLAIRRGNIPPAPIQAEYESYKQLLEEIESGKQSLPADDGLSPERFDNFPSVTNYHVDGRHRWAKVRRVDATSTGGPQTPPLKQHNVTGRFGIDGVFP